MAKTMGAAEHKAIRAFMRVYAPLNVKLYQLTNGKVLGKLQGYDVCLVTMTGARSGKQRTIPVMYVPHEDSVVVVASLGGAPKNPVWYYNLVAHPDVEVQYKGERRKLRARRVEGEEKARVWESCVKYYPPYEDYQARTDRDIPVFLCEPQI